MSGLWLISFRHLAHNRVQTLILTLCIAAALFLPATTHRLTSTYRRDLTARAEATPLVAGPRGNRFDLTLKTLYFRESSLPAIPRGFLDELAREGRGTAIPMHIRFTARGHPVVGTDVEYFELRGLRAARGTLPLRLGDAVLGHGVARALELGPGDHLFSDQKELYDISRPPALKMRVSGVLAERGTPDDAAVFVDVKTAWVMEGLAHGHDDAETGVDEALLLGRTKDAVVISGAMIEYNEVTERNVGSFHIHGDTSTLPLTAVVFVPRDPKAATMLKSKVNASGLYQMLVPREVIDDLMAFVFRIKSMLDTIAIVLGATTALLTLLVILLSMRIRAREMSTLNRIGCSRYAVAGLYGTELLIVIGVSVGFAAAGVLAAGALLQDLVTRL